MKKIINSIKLCHGQSLLEIIIAMAIFSLISASIGSFVLGGMSLLTETESIIEAKAIAQEGMEAARAIRDRAWNENIYNQSAVMEANNQWVFTGEGTTEQINKFTRTINFFPVYRDAIGDIVASTVPDSYLDPQSKEAEVEVSWATRVGINSTKLAAYFVNWDAREWTQTDWSGGSGQAEWADIDKYDNDDGNIEESVSGQITLKEIATSTFAVAGYLISSAYDVGTTTIFNIIEWDEDIPEECGACAVQIQIKTAPDDNNSPGTWSATWSGPDGDEDGDEDDYFSVYTGELAHTDHNQDQWIKYKAILTGEASSTPVLEEIRVGYKK